MKIYVKNPSENTQINTIAKLAEDGLSNLDISKRLTELGYKYLAAPDGVWTETRVKAVINNFSLGKTDRQVRSTPITTKPTQAKRKISTIEWQGLFIRNTNYISLICIAAYYMAIKALKLNIEMHILIAFVYIFIPIIFIPLVVYGISSHLKGKNALKAFRAGLMADGFSISHDLREFFIDTNKKYACFYQAQPDEGIKHWVLNFTDVLGTSIIKDSETVLKTSNSSVIGRALVGGVIFGGIGAFIGGATAKSSSSFKVSKLVLEIVLNCADHPVHRISFLNMPTGVPENGEYFKNIMKELEFTQVVLELMMMNEIIPPACNSVNFMDTVRMVKLKAQRDMPQA